MSFLLIAPRCLALTLAAFAAAPTRAGEGGASFYLLGSGGPGAALLPPVRGVFIDNTAYHIRERPRGIENS